MSHGKPKTEGLEWLLYSLNAFNGSGYADMSSPDDFIDSYMAYKVMRNKPDQAALARVYRPEATEMVRVLLERTAGASRRPAQKYLDKLEKIRYDIGQQGTLL